jgi:UPF0271 protein
MAVLEIKHRQTSWRVELSNLLTWRNCAEVSLKAETVCIHGDGKHALEFARAINRKLIEEDVSIQTI